MANSSEGKSNPNVANHQDRCYAPLRGWEKDHYFDCTNAITQMFYVVQPIRDYFIANADKGKEHRKYGSLFAKMVKLSKMPGLWYKDGKMVVLDKQSQVFEAQVQELMQEPDMARGSFRDAFELLKKRMKLIRDEANNASPETNAVQSVDNAQDAWKCHIAHTDDTFLNEQLTVLLETKLLFVECGHSYIEWQSFDSLQLNLSRELNTTRKAGPQTIVSLEDYMSDFLSDDVLPECDDCQCCFVKQIQPCCRQPKIVRFPAFVILALTRFDEDGNKNNALVQINTYIKLNDVSYRFHNAVLHRGTTQVGYYCTLVREEQNKWTLLIDPQIVFGITDDQADVLLARSAYIIMYEKVKHEDKMDEELMAELKAAYAGIEENPKLDPKPELCDKVLQSNDYDYDNDLNLLELDREISKIRNEMAMHCADYEIPEMLRHQRESFVPCIMSKHPYCGLENNNNVCYSNSVLQALYTCTQIRQCLLNTADQPRPAPCFLTLLSDLFSAMVNEFSKKRPVWSPSLDPEHLFNEQFRQVRKEFIRGQMNDAQEFFAILVELVHQEMNAASANRDQRPKEVPEFANATDQWNFYRTFVDDSPLANLLMGQMETKITCLTCCHSWNSWNAIWQLQLQLEEETETNKDSTLTLTDCLKEFSDPETLKNDCAPSCPRCQSRQPCTKQQTLCRVPSYLVIHLKRFAANGKKNDRTVHIEPKLTICEQQLELSSAVCHRGSETIGHYYILVRENDDQWVQLDDDKIDRSLSRESANEKLHSYAYLCIFELVKQEDQSNK